MYNLLFLIAVNSNPQDIMTVNFDEVPSDRTFAIRANLGQLELDLQQDYLYLMVSSPVGISALTNGNVLGFTGGLGLTFDLKRYARSYWKLDLAATVSYLQMVKQQYVDVGLFLGFRYEHTNGFTMVFRIPFPGYTFGSNGFLTHYLVALIDLPLITVGYRF